MNRTLLLILCDFLLLNLLALTRWESAEPARKGQPPVPELAANAPSAEQDLLAAMRRSLADERGLREQAAAELASTSAALSGREKELTAAEAERARLGASLADTQRAATELTQRVAAAVQETTVTQEQLARLQKELEAKRAEADRQAQAIATLEQQQAEARSRIENLSVAVKVAEQEKVLLKETADTFKQQVQAERQEREKVQATTVQLAAGVGQLAEKSGELSREIRDNRPINANVLYSDFLANRVNTTFTAIRPGLIGNVNRTRAAQTVLVTDGLQIYALLHVADSPFSLIEPGLDWDRIAIEFSRPPAYRSTAASFSFLSLDPRVIAIPVTTAQAAALGAKVYHTSLDPVKFPDVVLISSGGKGYGEVSFKLDAAQPGYVRVDNRIVKRLFGDYDPTRGDLVLSKTGELLGIMVTNDYCALVSNFLAARTIRTGDDVRAAGIGTALDDVSARYRALPFRLQ
jgi:predicted  nucleic acid-binding Zn-ribbon protein